jgi:hypothetical protein
MFTKINLFGGRCRSRNARGCAVCAPPNRGRLEPRSRPSSRFPATFRSRGCQSQYRFRGVGWHAIECERPTAVIGGRFLPNPFLRGALPEVGFGSLRDQEAMPRKGAVLVSCAPGSGHAARVRVTQAVTIA